MKHALIVFAIVLIAHTTDGKERAVRGRVHFFSATLDLAQLQPEQVRRYRAYEALPSTLRLRIADITVEPNRTRVLSLDLFDARSYVATMTKLEQTAGGYTWEGVLGGDGGRVILVVRGTQVTGWIWATRMGLRDEFFAISAVGGRTHIIRQTNQDWFNSVWPGCDTGEETPALATSIPGADAEPGDRKVAIANGSSCTCITNVLVAYTPAAQEGHGNIPALAQLAVTQANGSYANSQIDGLTLNLVGTMLVDYTESREKTNGKPTDLIRLKETSDDSMDDVHSMRDSLGADLVVLFVDDLDRVGLWGQAWQINATHDSAFAVVDWQAAVDHLVFAHEVGHLQGARHHNDPTTRPYEYGHGACHPSPYHYKTIMANPDCNEVTVPYWSSPDVFYKNVPTGDFSYRNNARVLHETSCSVGRRVQKAVAMLAYRPAFGEPERVITAFEGGGIYSSPDGLRLGGGCSTIAVYPGPQKVTAMLSYAGDLSVPPRVITAFEGGGIYSSPNGLNLGGGGSTIAVYPGPQRVRAMISYRADVFEPTPERVITAFEGGGIYSSPDGLNLGGGGSTIEVYPGPQRVTAMLYHQGRVITAFEGGGIYSSPDGLNLGGGGKTISVYAGPQRVTAMLSYQGQVITAFEGGGIYSSPDGLNLGGGGSTIEVYPGPQRVTMMLSYQGPSFFVPPRVITVFEGGSIYLSPDGLNLGGGGQTIAVYPGPHRVTAMLSYQGRVITAFDGAGIYSSPDGLNLGGGGSTISIYP